MGLRKSFSYDEVLRAIGQQPYSLEAPKRIGLKTYENIFFSNLINDQSSYVGGDVKKSGFSHEFPYEPPPRPDVFFDARSDEDSAPSEPPYMPDGRGGGGGGGGGGWGPPPPPPGNLGALQGLFGTRTGNMPTYKTSLKADKEVGG